MKAYHRLKASIFPITLFITGVRISFVHTTNLNQDDFVNEEFCFARQAKDKNKYKGTKQKVRAHKERLRKTSTVITCVIIFSLIALASYYLVNSFPSQNLKIDETKNNADNSSVNDSGNNSNTVALIDALHSTYPNIDFTRSLEKTLTEAGLNVEIYQGEEVTVDFLKNLKKGYKLVIFRMHSALSSSNALSLFTAEPYSQNEHWLERNYQLVREAYVTMDSQPVFGVNWAFVKQLMTGKFNGTLVIAMGCNGACDPWMSQEFINQGAIGYIAWNGPVLLSHSDEAIQYLIQALYKEKLPLEEAVEKTNNQIGADHISVATLDCYSP